MSLFSYSCYLTLDSLVSGPAGKEGTAWELGGVFDTIIFLSCIRSVGRDKSIFRHVFVSVSWSLHHIHRSLRMACGRGACECTRHVCASGGQKSASGVTPLELSTVFSDRDPGLAGFLSGTQGWLTRLDTRPEGTRDLSAWHLYLPNTGITNTLHHSQFYFRC